MKIRYIEPVRSCNTMSQIQSRIILVQTLSKTFLVANLARPWAASHIIIIEVNESSNHPIPKQIFGFQNFPYCKSYSLYSSCHKNQKEKIVGGGILCTSHENAIYIIIIYSGE
jgi:hypothetical protein